MYLGFWRPVALKPAPLLGVGRKCALELSNSGQTTINFYDANELIDIYYAMAKGNMDALAQNKCVGDRKSQALYRGYWAMNVAVVAVAVLFLLLLVRQWSLPVL